jgi:hypothetical protein
MGGQRRHQTNIFALTTEATTTLKISGRLVGMFVGSAESDSQLRHTKEILRSVRKNFPDSYDAELSSLDGAPLTIDPMQSGPWAGEWKSTDSPSESGTLKLTLY